MAEKKKNLQLENFWMEKRSKNLLQNRNMTWR